MLMYIDKNTAIPSLQTKVSKTLNSATMKAMWFCAQSSPRTAFVGKLCLTVRKKDEERRWQNWTFSDIFLEYKVHPQIFWSR